MQINTTLLTNEEKHALLLCKTKEFTANLIFEKTDDKTDCFSIVASSFAALDMQNVLHFEHIFSQIAERRANRILTLCHTGK